MTIAGFNQSFSLVRIAAVLTLACAASLAAVGARAQGTPEQRQACQPDAMRLCQEFIPDVDRITACMVEHRRQLSPACRVYFREEPKEKAAPKRGN